MIQIAVIGLALLAAPDDMSAMTIRPEASAFTILLGDKPWSSFSVPTLGDVPPEISVDDAGDGWQRVRMRWTLDEAIAQDELAIPIVFAANPDFWWAPHLAPIEGACIGQHVFRSPALVASEGAETFVVVPDLTICGAHPANPWFMDLDAPKKTLAIGMTKTDIPVHVGFRKVPGMTFEAGEVELGFFATLYRDDAEVTNPWRRVSDFLWDRFGSPLFHAGEPLRVPMDRYVDHTYAWAFDHWRESMWHEFEVDGQRAGGPAFIVNVTQSPNYDGEPSWREGLSIWNQAWFSTLRAMGGVWRYAARTGNEDLKRRADLSKALALAAPFKDGIFPTVYRTQMESVEVDGRRIHRTKGWETGHWTSSDRVPREQGLTPDWFHILDQSWTALLMLRWHQELEADPKLVEYAKTYADKLLTLQDEKGFFPAWLHPETLEPSPILAASPETSMSVTFLLTLAEVTNDSKYRDAAIRAMDAVLVEIVPSGRWEDFETYWSCCRWGHEYIGKKIPRNAMHKQCSFSMFWTAEALLATYHATRDPKYLAWGVRTLDELSMVQQIWQPPFIYIPALGGFGVMNFDGEWNDSRQCLFAELFLQYYEETGNGAYFERGIAALKSSFVMMYCPENPQAKVLWEKVWPFFGPEDYGFTMENYGHGGVTNPDGGGIGEFTIFTWGNGAAAEARNRIYDHYGDVYLDRTRQQGFGIDSIGVAWQDGAFVLHDLANAPRDVKITFDDGSTRTVRLEGTAQVK